MSSIQVFQIHLQIREQICLFLTSEGVLELLRFYSFINNGTEFIHRMMNDFVILEAHRRPTLQLKNLNW
jgi:hypothetical protein